MRQPYVVPRNRLIFAVWLTVLALPILVLDNVPRTDARAASVKVESTRASEPTTTQPTTTTIAEATTVAADEGVSAPGTPPVTAAPKLKAKTVVKASAPSTTTTTTQPPRTQQGGASWYDYRSGECAHVTLPKGTVVTITRLDTGASTTCVVTDRGPYESGRIIDLDRGTFAQLGDPAQGVIQVAISW